MAQTPGEISGRRCQVSPYSDEFRKRVLDAVDRREGSYRELALRFGVSLSFLQRLVQHRRRTGSFRPKPHGGGRAPALNGDGLERLRQLVDDQPHATLEELRERLGVDCSLAAISRSLKKLGMPLRKKSPRARKRDAPETRTRYDASRRERAGIHSEHPVIVDESEDDTAMTRTRGRALVGERHVCAVPVHWGTVTLIRGLRPSEETAPVVFQGTLDTAPDHGEVRRVLMPRPRPGDAPIRDGLEL